MQRRSLFGGTSATGGSHTRKPKASGGKESGALKVAKTGDTATLHKRALAACRQGRWDEAVALEDVVLSRNPGHVHALNARAWARTELRDYERALADADACTSLAPKLGYPFNHRSRIMLARGQADVALEQASVGKRLMPDSPWSTFHMASALVALGQKAEARALLEAEMQARPEFARNASLLNLLSFVWRYERCAWTVTYSATALEYAELAVRCEPDHSWSISNRAAIFYDKALAELSPAGAGVWETLPLRRPRGLAVVDRVLDGIAPTRLWCMGQHQRAVTLLSKCWTAHYHLAMCYLDAGDLARAVQHSDQALVDVSDGRSGWCWYLRGLLFAAHRQWPEALDSFERSSLRLAWSPVPLTSRAGVLCRLFRFSEARDVAMAAVAFAATQGVAAPAPDYYLAYYHLACAQAALVPSAGYEEPQEVVGEEGSAGGNGPFDAEQTARVAAAEAAAEAAARAAARLVALQTVDRAVAAQPGFFPSLALQGELRYAAGNLDGAVDSFTRALALEPARFPLYGCRAQVLRELGELDASEADRRQMFALREQTGPHVRGDASGEVYVDESSRLFRQALRGDSDERRGSGRGGDDDEEGFDDDDDGVEYGEPDSE